jgi:hypothetical protein
MHQPIWEKLKESQPGRRPPRGWKNNGDSARFGEDRRSPVTVSRQMGRRRTRRPSMHLGLWKARREESGVRNGVGDFYARRLSLPCGGERGGARASSVWLRRRGERHCSRRGEVTRVWFGTGGRRGADMRAPTDILIGNRVKF